MTEISRRDLLLAGGTGALGLAGGYLARGSEQAERHSGGSEVVQFYGEHQAGVTTPAQDRLVFGAFDLTLSSVQELKELFSSWTIAAAKMTRGESVESLEPSGPTAPPADTGEALGLSPAGLTITFGLGEGVFHQGGEDRFGLLTRRPLQLRPLGPLPREELDPSISGGDLCVQACADDPQVAFHAVRNLARLARGAAALRWAQLGFGRTSATTSRQRTLRNLQGFKDGTNNLHGDDPDQMRRFVWDSGDMQPWMKGGTFLVTRRIRMLIEAWDRDSLEDQQRVIGRFKASGAPLTGRAEHDPVELGATTPAGLPLIAPDAHIRLAAPSTNSGERILRRGYSFTDGIDPETGELDAGLFFMCFQRDPHRQFAEIQRRLGSEDALNEYIEHTSSALFAIPGGIRPGTQVAQSLFD